MVSPPPQLPSPAPSNASSHHPFSALANMEARAPSSHSYHSQPTTAHGHSRAHSLSTSHRALSPNGHSRSATEGGGLYNEQHTPIPDSTPFSYSQQQQQPAYHPSYSQQTHTHPAPFPMSPPFPMNDLNGPDTPIGSRSSYPPNQGGEGRGGGGGSDPLSPPASGYMSPPLTSSASHDDGVAYGVWHAGMEQWHGHSISAPTSVPGPGAPGYHPSMSPVQSAIGGTGMSADHAGGGYATAPLMGPPPLPTSIADRAPGTSANRRQNGESSRDRRRRGRSRARDREASRSREAAAREREEEEGLGGSVSRSRKDRDGSYRDKERDRERERGEVRWGRWSWERVIGDTKVGLCRQDTCKDVDMKGWM